jgi:5'-methylthioadenosine phosphorylase
LPREIELPYASIAVVVNHAAGRGDSETRISMERIAEVLETAMDRVRLLLEHVAALPAP